MGLSDAIAGWWVKDDVAEGKRLDDELAALNRGSLERGVWDEKTYQGAEARRQENAGETYPVQVVGAFEEGWQDGEQTISNAVQATVETITGTAQSIVTSPIRGLIRGIPWWLWLGGGIALLAYSGLLPGVISAARGALKK